MDIEKVVKQGRSGKVEENVRSIIIEELLECLGWNKLQGDLDFEHNVQKKKADIALMVEDSTGIKSPKVIVECKDLDINLDKYIDQAFEYAMKKQVKWIILTNGREIRLYSTFMENVPNRKDRLLIDPPIKLSELENRFNELEKWISKNNILKNSLERLTEKEEKKIQKKVNTRNLNTLITQYTPILKNFYKNQVLQKINKEEENNNQIVSGKILEWLNYKGINFKDKGLWSEIYGKEAAFNLLNRILFLRICEDRKFSEIATRLSQEGIVAWDKTHRKWTYNKLLKDSFKEIRKIDYESIYEENVFDLFELKEDILKEIIEKFSVINFKNIDSNILKNIYQEHISQEERKELGQYYTPDYIIHYILHSIDPLSNIEDLSPNINLKILDPACGSGGFLTEAYDIIKKKCIENNWDQDIIHEVILNKFLFGIDIEPFAAQLTSINLLIRDVDHPVNYVFVIQFDTLLSGGSNQSRIEPIKVKKIVSKDEDGEGEYVERDFPLDNYNIVVGNPPYYLISSQEGARSTGKKFHTTYLPLNLINKYKTFYRSWPHDNKNPNIFYIFTERGIELLENGGYLGFIIPDILLAGDSTKNLRKFILGTCSIKKIFLIDGKVFEKGGVTNIIIILKKEPRKEARHNNLIEVINTSVYELEDNHREGLYDQFIEDPHNLQQEIFYKNPSKVFSVRMTEETQPIFKKLFNDVENGKLINLGHLVQIHRGIENLKKEDCLDNISSTKKTIRKVIAVDNIEKFRINRDDPNFNQKFIDYDLSGKSKINFKKESWFTRRKIMVKRVSSELIAALEPKKSNKNDYLFTLDSVQMIWFKNPYKEKYNPRVLVAILNSDLMNFFYSTLFSYKRLFSRVQKGFLKRLPIPKKIEKKKQKEISDLVKELEQGKNKEVLEKLNNIINSLYFNEEELENYSKLLKPDYNLRDLTGIGSKKYIKLVRYGIKSLKDIIDCDGKKVIKEVDGVGPKSIKKWKEEARNFTDTD